MEYLLVSNGMAIIRMIGLTNSSHGLIGLTVDEFLVLRDGRLQSWLSVWHYELLYHWNGFAGVIGFSILRRSSDEVLNIAFLTGLGRWRFKRRRICSSIVFRLRDVLVVPLRSVRSPLDIFVEVRSVSCGSTFVSVLLYVLSVDLLQHVIIQRLIRIYEDRKKKCVCWNYDYTSGET